MGDLINVKKAAQILDVHPITIRRWNKAGKLKAARHPLNNYRLFKEREVHKLADKIRKAKSK